MNALFDSLTKKWKVKEKRDTFSTNAAGNFFVEGVAEKGRSLWNWGGHIMDSVLQYLPQPVTQTVTDTTKKVFSQENKQQVIDGFNTVKASFGKLFSSLTEEDVINLPLEDIPCAIIANIVYDDPFARPRKIETYDLLETFNDIEYCVYRDGATQKYMVGYRGTDAKETKDYISDINIVLGTQAFNDRFQESILVYDRIAALYPNDIKVITGHSLGGTICYMLAQLKEPDRTVVFNPGSSANPTFLMMFKDTELGVSWTKHVFTYRIAGDILSTLSVIGYTRTFRKGVVNPLESHAVKNFLPAGREEQQNKVERDIP